MPARTCSVHAGMIMNGLVSVCVVDTCTAAWVNVLVAKLLMVWVLILSRGEKGG